MLVRRLEVPSCNLQLCFIRPCVAYSLSIARQVRFSALHSARLPPEHHGSVAGLNACLGGHGLVVSLHGSNTHAWAAFSF